LRFQNILYSGKSWPQERASRGQTLWATGQKFFGVILNKDLGKVTKLQVSIFIFPRMAHVYLSGGAESAPPQKK